MNCYARKLLKYRFNHDTVLPLAKLWMSKKMPNGMGIGAWPAMMQGTMPLAFVHLLTLIHGK